jgi:HEAT repeat protein
MLAGRRGVRSLLAGLALLAQVTGSLGAAPDSGAAAPGAADAAATLSAEDGALLRDVETYQWDALKAVGPSVLDGLLRLYRTGDEERRANVARAFYVLGWESEEAAALLLADVHTPHQGLRLQAQWALGRVSDSPVVVEVLLENMMNDPNPLFRDKAACALANDQIHLSEARKVRLFEGLIEALGDSKQQVRAIALQALKFHTGQDKGFAAAAPEPQRAEAIARWRRWLDDYRAQL